MDYELWMIYARKWSSFICNASAFVQLQFDARFLKVATRPNLSVILYVDQKRNFFHVANHEHFM